MFPLFFFGGYVVSVIFTFCYPKFKELRSTYSIGAFLAFIIAGIEAILGTFNLRSAVIIAGAFMEIVIRPVSTYLVTYIRSFFIYILDAKVA